MLTDTITYFNRIRIAPVIYSNYLSQIVFLVDSKVRKHVEAPSSNDHAERLTKIKVKCTSRVKSNVCGYFDTNFQKFRLRFVWSNGNN